MKTALLTLLISLSSMAAQDLDLKSLSCYGQSGDHAPLVLFFSVSDYADFAHLSADIGDDSEYPMWVKEIEMDETATSISITSNDGAFKMKMPIKVKKSDWSNPVESTATLKGAGNIESYTFNCRLRK